MITASEARKLKKTVDNFLTDALERIDQQIRHAAQQYHSTRYELTEFNERSFYKLLIEQLEKMGYEVQFTRSGSEMALHIRWDNFTVCSDGNA